MHVPFCFEKAFESHMTRGVSLLKCHDLGSSLGYSYKEMQRDFRVCTLSVTAGKLRLT
jgi:hypothetical protein